jgi:hypothetical protein
VNAVIHPRCIKQDLEKNGFACWFSESPETVSIDTIAIVLRNSRLVLFCITDNFVNDKKCVEIFEYAKNILSKNYMLVVLGQSLEWQKSNIGALTTVIIDFFNLGSKESQLPTTDFQILFLLI